MLINIDDLIEGRLDYGDALALSKLRVEAIRRLGRERGPGLLQDPWAWSCIKDKIAMVLTPEGALHDFAVLEGIHHKKELRAFLVSNADCFLPPPGSGPVQPVSSSYGSRFVGDGGQRLLYHLSRHLSSAEVGKDRVLAMKSHRRTPCEDWILLSEDDLERLVPRDAKRLGKEWEIEAGIARRLLTYLRPPSHNRQVSASDVIEASLRARVTALQGARVRVALSGHVRLEHPDILVLASSNINKSPVQGGAGWIASARVIGFLDVRFDWEGRAYLDDLGLVTEGGRWLSPDPSIQSRYGSFISLPRPPLWGPLFLGRELR